MVSDASQVYASASELDDKQHLHPPQQNRVDGEAGRRPGSRRPAGAGTTASSSRHAEARGQDRGRAESCGSSWPTPASQAATARHGSAGRPTADSRGQAARPPAAPVPISEVGPWIWMGRSSTGPPCAGASAAASRVAPGTPTTAPVGAGGSAPQAAPGPSAAGGAVDAGGVAPRARGARPGSRSPWPPPSGSRA
jgi:hypothetical protein